MSERHVPGVRGVRSIDGRRRRVRHVARRAMGNFYSNVGGLWCDTGMDHFSVVDALVGRLEQIDRDLSRLAGARPTVLGQLAHVAREGADALVGGSEVRRRERVALARRAVISDVAAATRTTEHVVGSLMAEGERLVTDFPATLDALRGGALTHRQAQVILGEAVDLDADTRTDLERRLLLLARTGNHVTLKRQARRERERVLPESFQVRHARAVQHRNVRIEHVRDGMSWLTLYGPTGQLASIEDRLQMIALAHRHAGDPRTADQLITDAVVAALLAPECACTFAADGGGAAGAVAAAQFPPHPAHRVHHRPGPHPARAPGRSGRAAP